ncbi:MAG: hypothetical protein NT038_03920 [Euryarchaeota archaeon]|nr:hypothetical protein [Euryarchaeota archaeon]
MTRQPQSKILADKLLNHGGKSVTIVLCPFTQRILTDGKLLSNQIRQEPQTLGACHCNTYELAEKNGYSRYTGYALCCQAPFLDEWQRHSWCMDKDGVIVESTLRFSLYYGIPLSVSEYDDMLVKMGISGLIFKKAAVTP